VESKLASSEWGFAPGLKEGGFIYLNADVRKENDVNAAKAQMMATLDELVSNPPTQEEVDRAKSRILKNWELAYNSSEVLQKNILSLLTELSVYSFLMLSLREQKFLMLLM